MAVASGSGSVVYVALEVGLAESYIANVAILFCGLRTGFGQGGLVCAFPWFDVDEVTVLFAIFVSLYGTTYDGRHRQPLLLFITLLQRFTDQPRYCRVGVCTCLQLLWLKSG